MGENSKYNLDAHGGGEGFKNDHKNVCYFIEKYKKKVKRMRILQCMNGCTKPDHERVSTENHISSNAMSINEVGKDPEAPKEF